MANSGTDSTPDVTFGRDEEHGWDLATASAAGDVVCPVCGGEAFRDVDERGDKWDTCESCEEVFVTAAHLNSPTMRYPIPEHYAGFAALQAEHRG